MRKDSRQRFWLAAIIGISISLGTLLAQPLLLINECMTDNRVTLPDEDDDFQDWIEIKNAGSEPVDLSGYGLSDDLTQPLKWRFPSVPIEPGEYLLVFCSGKDRRPTAAEQPNEAAPPVLPREVPGLRLWLDATDTDLVVEDRGKVPIWLDKSWSGNDAFQGDPEAQPSLIKIFPQEHPAVYMDGIEDFLELPRLSDIRGIFWALRLDPFAASTIHPLLGDRDSFDFLGGLDGILFSEAHTPRIQAGEVRVNGIGVDPRIARMPPGPAMVSVVTSGNVRANTLSADRPPHPSTLDWKWHGWIGEVLIYNQELSTEHVEGIESYLREKWRLPNEYLHTNFRLRAAGQEVHLSDPQGNLIDRVVIPGLDADVSYGRDEGDMAFGFYAAPTPVQGNITQALAGIGQKPVFSHLGGHHAAPLELSLSVPGAQGVVRYSTDGSEPHSDSAIYENPLVIDETTVVRARTFRAGYHPSETVTRTFVMNEPSTFATVSVAGDPEGFFDIETGIFEKGPRARATLPHRGANFWREWERPVHVEYYREDGAPGIAQLAGLKVHGGWSRVSAQKSLALIARNRYGDSRFTERLFSDKPITEFKQLLFRNSGNDWIRTLFRDALTHRILSKLELDWQAYRPVQFLLNGQYWGIYNLRERVNDRFIVQNTGLDIDEIDLLENDKSIMAGDSLHFESAVAYLAGNDPNAEGFIDGAEEFFDIENLFDYMMAEIFVGNGDWPINNVRFWRPRRPEGRWRWLPYDMDGGFNILHEDGPEVGVRVNMLERVLSSPNRAPVFPWPVYCLNRILGNQMLKNRFINRFADRLNGEFSASEILPIIDMFQARLEPEIQRHIDRWGGQKAILRFAFASTEEWIANIDVMREFARERATTVREHIADYFDLNGTIEFRMVYSEDGGVGGNLRVNDTELPATGEDWVGTYFRGVPIEVVAKANDGYRFVRWKELQTTDPAVTIDVASVSTLTPEFERVGPVPEVDPAPHDLRQGPYLFGSFDSDSPAGTYPPNMIFQTTSQQDPKLGDAVTGKWELHYDLSRRSRINALDEQGFSFINTSQAQSGEGGGYVAAALLSLNTEGTSQVWVSWSAGTVTPNNRIYALRLQYRIGESGVFKDVIQADGTPAEYQRNERAGHSVAFGPTLLPGEAANQPLLQLWWRYFFMESNATGARAELRVDDIFVMAGDAAGVVPTGPVAINEIMYHPASQDPRDEFIELLNTGSHGVNLAGWAFEDGVTYSFPDRVLGPGETLVVVADRDQFVQSNPDVANVVGNWEGRLSNSSERLELIDGFGNRVEEITYADEGDWSVRTRGPLENGFQGWTWSDDHDGGGKSLERINPRFESLSGQNWRASEIPGGTPGDENSIWSDNIPPVIIDVLHAPLVPRSSDTVFITAKLTDEDPSEISAALFYRRDGDPMFERLPLRDDGQHGDGRADDAIYGVRLPAFPNDSIVEFYVEARDGDGNSRTWPPAAEEDAELYPRCLFQVDDRVYGGDQPLLKVVMTQAERTELDAIDQLPWNRSSDARMSGTFLSNEAGELQVRYQVGIRLRGTTSRASVPKNRRIDFSSEQRWNGADSITLNTVNVHSQVMGSILCRLAGVPTLQCRPVQFRENNVNHAKAGFPQFGSYAQLEALDGQFTARQFPQDPDGYLYRAFGHGKLEFLGDDPLAYQAFGFYTKSTQREANDWSDLIALTRALDATSDEAFVSEASQWANLDEWIRYFAVDTLLANLETSFANGNGGDYNLYRGLEDPRFVLLPYDLDSVLGMNGGATADLFRAARNRVTERLLHSREFSLKYFAELERLANTVFLPENFDSVADQALGGWVDPGAIERMKAFAAQRRAFVLAQIPQSFTMSSALPLAEPSWLRYRVTTDETTALRGTADGVRTRRVEVNGREAHWMPWSGEWAIEGLPLNPGVNSIVTRLIDERGEVHDEATLWVWRDTGSGTVVDDPAAESVVLPGNTTWTPSQSPILVKRDLVIPPGVKLDIEAGTSIFFSAGSRLAVQGQLRANGRPENRILMSFDPQVIQPWGGIRFVDSVADNALDFVTIGYAISPSLILSNSVVRIQGADWDGIHRVYLHSFDSSLEVRDSRFPNVNHSEPIGAIGIPPGGFWILKNNVIGTTSGYNDVVEFSGAKLPGPIPQIIDNVFLGGDDDALDLDGTDAWVAGNVFMNFHKNNTSTSESHAIATGSYEGRSSELTIVRNVFFDNDYDILLRERAVARIHHNTFVNSTLAGLNFREVQRVILPAAEADLDGNIFWGQTVQSNYFVAKTKDPALTVSIRRSIVRPADFRFGAGNFDADPRFVDPEHDFRLRPGSPAIGSGPNGLDMGAFVPAGASITGGPRSRTPRRDAEFTVGGPGIVSYRMRLNDGPWSPESPIEQTIALQDLEDGVYEVSAIGKNVAGVWQSEAEATVSRRWRVEGGEPMVAINEVLAINRGVLVHGGGTPDYIELFNPSDLEVDLSGKGLTDQPGDPYQFVFPVGTILEPGGYLLVFGGDPQAATAELEVGFSLSGDGDGVYLFESPSREAGLLLDSVEFGLQLSDMTLGRTSHGDWRLGEPTPGSLNREVPLGDRSLLLINEWLANRSDANPTEYIELVNGDSLPVALGGLYLSNEPATFWNQHRIPPLSFIQAGGFSVFEADGKPGASPVHLGFALAAAQGMIGLFEADGSRIDQVWYGSQLPDIASGRIPSGGMTIGSQSPSPGYAIIDDSQSVGIVMSEVQVDNRSLPGPGGFFDDWIELHNPRSEPVDLSGMSLSNSAGEPGRWVLAEESWIEPGGYFTIGLNGGPSLAGDDTVLDLNEDGDSVVLFDRAGQLVDTITFGIQVPGLSLGRVQGRDRWALIKPSPGEENQPLRLAEPGDLRINEWLADPLSGEDWFELYNTADDPVDLSGLFLSDDPNEPNKHQLADHSYLGSGSFGYLNLTADGEPQTGGRHVDFKLSGSGEEIVVTTFDGRLIDRISFGGQQEGISQGRIPNGGDLIQAFTNPTPGAPNIIDADGDGLPDSWELEFGLDPAVFSDANADGDGDGYSNINEYRAGTRPDNAQSVLEITAFILGESQFSIRFDGVSGQAYEVQTKNSLDDEEWRSVRKVNSLSVSMPLELWADIGMAQQSTFFRVISVRE